jgi:hypothetical protein
VPWILLLNRPSSPSAISEGGAPLITARAVSAVGGPRSGLNHGGGRSVRARPVTVEAGAARPSGRGRPALGLGGVTERERTVEERERRLAERETQLGEKIAVDRERRMEELTEQIKRDNERLLEHPADEVHRENAKRNVWELKRLYSSGAGSRPVSRQARDSSCVYGNPSGIGGSGIA